MLSTTTVRLASATTEAEKKRQRIVLLGGGAVIAGLLAYLLWPEADRAALAVEVVTTTPRAAPPPPIPAVQTPAPAAMGAPLPNYQLFGIGGGGPEGRAAIIGLPGGGQRVVPEGRALGSGVVMKEVGADYAVLSTPNGEMRLEFRKTAQPIAAQPAGTSQPVAATATSRQQALTHYRLGMEPRKTDRGIAGYRIQSANLPMLSNAGLRSGDILLSVNGEVLDSEERFFALAEKLAEGSVATLTYERDGKMSSAQVRTR